MGIRTQWRLWRAKTVPATTLVVAFLAGAVVTVPPTLWLGVGRREVVRLVPAASALTMGHTPAATSVSARHTLTPVLRQSLHDLERWAKPSTAARRVEAFLAAQGGSAAARHRAIDRFPTACASPKVIAALDRQLRIQITIKRSRLSIDAFGTKAFGLLSQDVGAAMTCLDGALTKLPDAASSARVELVRLMARLAPAETDHARAMAAFRREASRAVVASSEAAPGPVYALHAYLAVEGDLARAGETVRNTVHAQRDPVMQLALKEVVNRRFSQLVTSWAM